MDATEIKIAIIGAGPVGCMLARLLQLANVPCTVFEADASPDYRSQGGTLDLRTGTGLAALREAGLFDEFEKLARYDGESMFITDKDLNVQFQLDPSPGSSGGRRRPEIDRSQLRRLLAESLPADTIRWGHRLLRVDEAADGERGGRQLQLVFEHAIVDGYSLVVGADGVWSRTRAFLSDVQPTFAGLGMYEMSVPDPEARTPELHTRNRRGSTFACAEGRRVSVQQMGGSGELYVSVTFRVDNEAWIGEERRLARPLAQVKELLLGPDSGTFGDYHPLLRDAVDKAQGACKPRALYALPVGFRWEHRPGVTLVGDAAHVMTPYAGEGVNVGLEDARRLASAVVAVLAGSDETASGQDLLERLDHAVEGFEEEMWSRARKYAELTDGLMKLYFFTPGSPRATIARIVSMHACFQVPWAMRPLASAGVHAFYFFRHLAGH